MSFCCPGIGEVVGKIDAKVDGIGNVRIDGGLGLIDALIDEWIDR